MGNGIAHTFAQNGFSVSLVDIHEQALERAVITIGQNLDRQVKKGTIDEASRTETLQRIQTFTKLEEGIKEADLVVEAATENEKIKLELFAELDRLC